VSKPTFLTLKADTQFRNNGYNPSEWRAYLNGVAVNAVTADTERGYVDVIFVLDEANKAADLKLHRLFGKVELRSVFGDSAWQDEKAKQIAASFDDVSEARRQRRTAELKAPELWAATQENVECNNCKDRR